MRGRETLAVERRLQRLLSLEAVSGSIFFSPLLAKYCLRLVPRRVRNEGWHSLNLIAVTGSVGCGKQNAPFPLR
ncbi:MAG: hypothetical protein DMF38_09220 [Verrucomicrobia bacterium]|nr:MAG: hypothetical protein DME78_09835 [Verrucomicrobiota bacterium]PYL34139.1 MAG: hypothetical protein DMF38_09220 [Verrucomicrobiota bacterium]